MQLFDRVCNMITEDEESLARSLCTVDQQNQQAMIVQGSHGKIKGLSLARLSLFLVGASALRLQCSYLFDRSINQSIRQSINPPF